MTDHILDGRLRLRQWRAGHRAGTDAILLAAAAPIEAGDVFVDVGCGVGTVGLILALTCPEAHGVLLDDDAAVLELAEANSRDNGVAARLRIARADLFDSGAWRAAELRPERASLVVTNPPFFRGDEIRVSPQAARARAHALGRGGRVEHPGHGAWLRASLALLAPKGRFCAIHRPEVLSEWLAVCEGRLGAIRIVPVHARRDTPAVRILLSGVKGSRAPLCLDPPLILHEADGRFTPRAEALHRGRLRLPATAAAGR